MDELHLTDLPARDSRRRFSPEILAGDSFAGIMINKFRAKNGRVRHGCLHIESHRIRRLEGDVSRIV